MDGDTCINYEWVLFKRESSLSEALISFHAKKRIFMTLNPNKPDSYSHYIIQCASNHISLTPHRIN